MKKSFGLRTVLLTAAVVLCGCSIEKPEDANDSECRGICLSDRIRTAEDCRLPMTWHQSRCVDADSGAILNHGRDACLADGHRWSEGYCEIPERICNDDVGIWTALTMLDLGNGRYIRDLGSDRYICGSYNDVVIGTAEPESCSKNEIAFLNSYIEKKRCTGSSSHCIFAFHTDAALSDILMCSACSSGFAQCADDGGVYDCRDLKNDSAHCGRCGNRCPDGGYCKDGECRTESLVCPENTLNCGKKEDGSPLCIDPNNNNSCGAECKNGAYLKDDTGLELKGEICGKNAVCTAGECKCSSSTLACLIDGSVQCIDPMIDPSYCGAYNDTNKTVIADDNGCPFDHAGKVCKNEEHASGFCGLGKCMCAGNYVKCGDRCIDPKKDPEFCGADNNCEGGEKCMAPSTCNDGKCGCETGMIYCNGKCIDPASDEYCGITDKCDDGIRCGDYQTCDPKSLKCGCDAAKGYLQCGKDCIDPKTDPKRCGATSCTAEGEGGEECSEQNAVCVDGRCTNICPDDQELCNGVCMVLNTRDHCGKCRNACPGETVCTEFGSFGYACQCPTGKNMCTWNGKTACFSERELEERNLINKAGACSCKPDYGDCDGKPFNGCEISLKTNSDNCGQCGKTCGSSAECKDGACSTLCPNNTMLCGNECVDLKSNSYNCGGCGLRCSDAEICENGKCLCGKGASVCNGKCVNINSDPNNCAKCGRRCGGAAVCKDGTCYGDKKKCIANGEDSGGTESACCSLKHFPYDMWSGEFYCSE